MLCHRCGYKLFDDSKFCSQCGNVLDNNEKIKNNVEETCDLHSGNNTQVIDTIKQSSYDTQKIDCKAQPVGNKKLSWYLSVPVLMISFLFCFPVSLGLLVARFIKTKGTKKFRSTLIYTICLVALFGGISALMIAEERTFNRIETAISNGQYETAYTLLRRAENGFRSPIRVRNAFVEFYESQGLYDEAAGVLVRYSERFDTNESIADATIAQLNNMIDLVSDEKRTEIQSFISNIELQRQLLAEAEEREDAEREAARIAEAEAIEREESARLAEAERVAEAEAIEREEAVRLAEAEVREREAAARIAEAEAREREAAARLAEAEVREREVSATHTPMPTLPSTPTSAPTTPTPQLEDEGEYVEAVQELPTALGGTSRLAGRWELNIEATINEEARRIINAAPRDQRPYVEYLARYWRREQTAEFNERFYNHGFEFSADGTGRIITGEEIRDITWFTTRGQLTFTHIDGRSTTSNYRIAGGIFGLSRNQLILDDGQMEMFFDRIN